MSNLKFIGALAVIAAFAWAIWTTAVYAMTSNALTPSDRVAIAMCSWTAAVAFIRKARDAWEKRSK